MAEGMAGANAVFMLIGIGYAMGIGSWSLGLFCAAWIVLDILVCIWPDSKLPNARSLADGNPTPGGNA